MIQRSPMMRNLSLPRGPSMSIKPVFHPGPGETRLGRTRPGLQSAIHTLHCKSLESSPPSTLAIGMHVDLHTSKGSVSFTTSKSQSHVLFPLDFNIQMCNRFMPLFFFRLHSPVVVMGVQMPCYALAWHGMKLILLLLLTIRLSSLAPSSILIPIQASFSGFSDCVLTFLSADF